MLEVYMVKRTKRERTKKEKMIKHEHKYVKSGQS